MRTEFGYNRFVGECKRVHILDRVRSSAPLDSSSLRGGRARVVG